MPLIKKTKKFSIAVILIALGFLLAWIFNIKEVITLSGTNSNMKASTAILFLISGIISLYCAKKNTGVKIAFTILIISISIISLLSYSFPSLSFLDNLIITDTYSNFYPGKMSPATSLLFLTVSLIFLLSEKTKYKNLLLFLHSIILTIAYISLISYLLGIRVEDKSLFFKSLSLQTSIVFILLSFSISLKNNGIVLLFLSKRQGSQLLKYFLPAVIFIPFFISKYLIYTKAIYGPINETSIKIFTIILVLTKTLLLFILAIRFNNIDESKTKVTQELQAANLKLNNLLNAIKGVMIIEKTDKDGKIIEINKKYEELSKYTKEEIIGQSHRIINSNYHTKEFFTELWSTIKAGNTWFGTIKNKAKDGTFYWVDTAIIPFLNPDNTIKEYVGIKRDVTEQKEQITELNKKYIQQLEKEKIELEQLAYTTSHYLLEPLRIVNMFSLILKNEVKELDAIQGNECINGIRTSSIQVEKVVKDLLKYLNTGKQITLTSIDLNLLLQDIFQEYSEKYSTNKDFIYYEQLPLIKADKQLLRIVFNELIENAIIYKKDREDLKILISSNEDNLFWYFKISDNGIGIKEIDQARIFEIFQQLNKKHNNKGNGLGLSICKKIIHLHQGEITLKSKLGEGTEISFSIRKNIR